MVNADTTEVVKVNKNGVDFSIKNNILYGKELAVPEKHLNAGEIIFQIFKRKPGFIAQIEAETGNTRTYKEMLNKSIRCAIWLRKQGIKRGDVVAMCCSSHFDGYVPFLACLFLGVTCAVEYHKLPIRSFCHFLSTVTPKTIFLHKYALQNFISAQNELNMNIQRVLFEDGVPDEVSLNEIMSMQTQPEIAQFRCEPVEDPKDVALLIGTSGSTGLPKMAELSYLSMKTMLSPEYTSNMKTQITMCAAGIRWITYFLDILSALRGDSTRIIVEDGRDAKYYCEVIKKYKVKYYSADTNQIRQIYKLNLVDAYAATNLFAIGFGGSPFSRDIHETLLKQVPHIVFAQLYGSTDVGNCVTGQRKGCKPGSCGFVRAGVKLKVVSLETGEALGPNQQGEICVMTPTQLNGYRNNPEATKKAIDSEGWVHMNDIGYYDEDGELYIVGRLSEFIKYKDCCISVPEMEAILDMHPAVYKAAVIATPSEIEGEVPIAVIIKLPDKEVTENEVMDYFRNNLPEFYALGGVIFLKDFPYTNTGKVAKSELKQIVCNGLM